MASWSTPGHTGANTVAFEGRLSQAHQLRLGTYKLTIVATDSSGHGSPPSKLTFTIVK